MINKLWLATERFFLYQSIRFFRLRGQSERIARGFALGVAVNFFPTFGFGVFIAGFVAKALGGNAVAGFVGGALLTFLWPILFYLNIRLGRYFVPPPLVVERLADVNESTVDALVWGKTFFAGAFANTFIFGLSAYIVLRLFHWRLRPYALAYFRHHAIDHQRRFRRTRPAFSSP